MGRFLVIIGILLMCIVIPVFVIALVMMESEQFADFVGPLVCDVEEQFLVVMSTPYIDSDGSTVRSANMYCLTGTNARREVTGIVVLVIVFGFIIGLGGGILLMIWGIFVMADKQTQPYRDTAQKYSLTGQDEQPLVFTSSYQGDSGGGVVDVFQVMNTVLDNLGMSQNTFQHQPLAERLRQLQDAYDQGLISKEEYDRLRTAILDKMDD